MEEFRLEMVVVRLGHIDLDATNQNKLALSESVVHNAQELRYRQQQRSRASMRMRAVCA